jgi:hypothetical protein
MNLLLEQGLPEEIDGVTIYPDFRNMIRFEAILQDETMSESEKCYAGLRQLFEKLPPGGTGHAMDRLLWFYTCGKLDSAEAQKKKPAHGGRAYDFEQDAGCIYAGFLQAYQIDLTEIPYLHWWSFAALLENLPSDTAMAQRMQLRLMDVSQIKDNRLREKYAAQKRAVALYRTTAKGKSAEELSRMYLEKVERRFKEAEKLLKNTSS